MAGRKRKQQALGPPAIPDTVASLSVPTIAPTNADDNITAVPPLTDEQAITSIVTKRLPSDSVEDVTEALESLRILVNSTMSNFDENRMTAFRRGAPITVVIAMRRHGISQSIQTSGMRVLSEISCCKLDKNFNQDIIAVGGLQACLEAMTRHDDIATVHAYGCLLIGNLWRYVDVRKKVVDEGGLKAVVKAMEKYKENTKVQRWGCHALKTLFLNESTWADGAVDTGCIDLVIAAMNNYPDDAKLQLYGCEFLTLLAKAKKDYRDAILDTKGLIPVGEALRIHKNNEKVKQAAQAANAAIIA